MGKTITRRVKARNWYSTNEVNNSEGYYKDFFENAPDMIMSIDPRSKIITECNKSVVVLTGYKKEEVIGRSALKLYHPDCNKELFKYWEIFEKTGEIYNAELQVKAKDGSKIDVIVNAISVRDANGKVINSRSIWRDITDLKKANSRLFEAERKFEHLLEFAPDAMILIDESGIIQIANKHTIRLFGYPRKMIIGKKVEMLIPNRFHKNHEAYREDYKDHPKVREMGTHLGLVGKHKDGSEIPVEISLSPIYLKDKTHVAAVIRDVSERRKMINDLQRTNLKLQNANTDLKQFAYVASHDLQEPLKTLNGIVQLFRNQYEEKLDESAKEFLDYMEGSAERMKLLVGDLLEYSSLGKEKELSKIDCNKLLKNTVRDLVSLINEKKALIKTSPLPTIYGYEIELKRLFQNLIVNAIKFRKPGCRPEIKISSKLQDNNQIFSVEDNGIGIDEEHKDTVFVIFKRLHNQKEYKGSGIGLAQCKKIVELHGGEIWVKSQPGKGSTFYFSIPIANCPNR